MHIGPLLSDTGSNVLVLPHGANEESNNNTKASSSFSIKLRKAMISDMDRGTADVIYDVDGGAKGGNEEEEEEEDGVAIERIIAIATKKDDDDGLFEQAKIYLNISRCYLKSPSGRIKEAIESASLCLTLLKMMEGTGGASKAEAKGSTSMSNAEREKLFINAYQIRAKALSRGNDYKEAHRDARRLAQLPGQREGAKKLWREIEKEMEYRQKSDRKLVKSMSKWIDSALKSSASGNGNEAREAGMLPPPPPPPSSSSSSAAASREGGGECICS